MKLDDRKLTWVIKWSEPNRCYIGSCPQHPELTFKSMAAEGALIGIRGMICLKLKASKSGKNKQTKKRKT